MDNDWLEDLCADVVEHPEQVQIFGGTVLCGERARVIAAAGTPEATARAGQTVKVLRIAVGNKGKGHFRKRIWVALWVESEDGMPFRVLAPDLQVL